MSTLRLSVEEGTQGDVSMAADSPLMNCVSNDNFSLKEHNYLALSDCSSVDSSPISSSLEDNKSCLNLKATELRLGLPGYQSPERDTKFEEIPLFPLLPLKDRINAPAQKAVVSGNKRGFSNMGCFQQPVMPLNTTQDTPSKGLQERSRPENEMKASNNSNNAPAAKAQVVGWPPIRSFRKNTLANTSKNNDEVDGKPGPGTLFVKVGMDGAPYLRKVDLRLYSTYQELSSALEKMFSGFTIGQCGSHGTSGNDKLSDSKLRDLLNGSEYVLTYEDKDGDWMLMGDVPWEMFTETCKRLKIMKSSDAIGLAPRAVGKLSKA